jgi:two-component system, NtrC family, sensor kinase
VARCLVRPLDSVRGLRSQFANTLLLVLSAAAIVAAVINFQQLRKFQIPDDGVTWADRAEANGPSRVLAIHISPGSTGDKAQIHLGDELVAVDGTPVRNALDVARILWSIPLIYERPTQYTLRRGGIEFQKDKIFIQTAEPEAGRLYEYAIGFAYLAIGLFVFYRRTNARKALHFFLLCLFSFLAFCFHYTGKLNTFDEIMYWGNIVGNVLAPTIFLHFCITFLERPNFFSKGSRWLVLYLPSVAILALLLGTAQGWVHFPLRLIEVRWLFDRGLMAFSMALYLLGVIALTLDYRFADDPIVRRQLKYLRNGAVVGLLPFAVGYVVPYLLGSVPTHLMSLSVLSLGLIPITWAYAVTRYRLMDVDIIFQQGYVYTLATLAVLGTFYGLIFVIFNPATITAPAFLVLILFATFIFQPIRRFMQEQLERYVFYRDRYDYRSTLVEFARELSSETDLNTMLSSVSSRLLDTLSLQQIAFFLGDEHTGKFRFSLATQKSGKPLNYDADMLDLQFLDDARLTEQYLFFERPRSLRDIVSQTLPASVRETVAELDLTTYVPCVVRGRTIAWFGVSRTIDGDFLSTEDVELLRTLSGSVAIAIENSRLYHSLQRKVDEYEHLKEFSENIVESISVGILAADLEDRVESWNPQIEKLIGIPRLDAIGRRLHDLFDEEMCEKFDELKGRAGIHNLYKVTLRPRPAKPQPAQLPAVNGPGAHVNGVTNGNANGSQNGANGPSSGSFRLANGLSRNGQPAEPPSESIVNVALAPLVSKDGLRIGRLIIFDDVTDRDELERRLVQADKLSSIGLLAAGVAHEVNTPLAVISTYSQMLAKQVIGDEHKSKLLEKISKQTFRASEIVNSLLNFSRTSPTEFVELDLNRVLRETLSLIEHQLEKSGVAVRAVYPENLPRIRGNSGKLQQVFLNLFLNARDAMHNGGTLSVRSWGEAGFAHVEVADTGQGIDPEHLARIYDPFFTTKAAKKGTGLGLSVTYGIMQEHNGIIEVESDPGAGTRFRLEFPACSSVSNRPEAPAAQELAANS